MSSSSNSDTETEEPLSQEGYLYMKDMYPNLSDEINGIEMERVSVVKTENQGEEVVSSTTGGLPTNNIIQYINAIPLESLNNRGRYGFKMQCEVNDKTPSKSCNYTYSHMLDKLFTQKDKAIPFTFHTDIQLPCNNVEIRSYLIYKEMTCRDTIVDRCPHHMSEPFQSDVSKHHIMDSAEAQHVSCPATGRFVTQFKPSFPASKCFKASIRFRCSSTCRGGIDRRQVLALFELYLKGSYEGRSMIEVCVCSSPGRDRQNCEDKMSKKNDGLLESPDVGQKRAKRARLYSLSANSSHNHNHDGKYREQHCGDIPVPADDGYFYVKVKGVENANMLAKMAEKLNQHTDFINLLNHEKK